MYTPLVYNFTYFMVLPKSKLPINLRVLCVCVRACVCMYVYIQHL